MISQRPPPSLSHKGYFTVGLTESLIIQDKSNIHIATHLHMYCVHHYHHHHQVVLTAQGSLILSLCLSLATCLYHPSHLVSLLNWIQCPHRADKCKSLLACQHWHVYKEFILISPDVRHISCLSYLDGLWDKWQVAVKLLFCWVLLPGFVENST